MRVTLERAPEGGFDIWERPNGIPPTRISHHVLMQAARRAGVRAASDRGYLFISRVDDPLPSAVGVGGAQHAVA